VSKAALEHLPTRGLIDFFLRQKGIFCENEVLISETLRVFMPLRPLIIGAFVLLGMAAIGMAMGFAWHVPFRALGLVERKWIAAFAVKYVVWREEK
jgi:hypothetical protein